MREVTEIAKDYDTPILAAGGVTTGAHIVAALALGASGVWCGTIWQTTHESETSMAKKQKLLDSGNQDAWVSEAIDGKRMRVIRGAFLDVFDAPDAPPPLAMPLQGMLLGKLEQAVEDHQVYDWLRIPAGQGVGFVTEMKPARQALLDLVEEARDSLDWMGFDPPDDEE